MSTDSYIEEIPSDDEDTAPSPQTQQQQSETSTTTPTTAADDEAAKAAAAAETQKQAEEKAAAAERERIAQQEADENGTDVDMSAVERLKQRGNHVFGTGDYSEALRLYDIAASRALHIPRKDGQHGIADGIEGDESAPSPGQQLQQQDEQSPTGASSDSSSSPPPEPTPDERKAYQLTAQVYCNGGAACMKLQQYNEAIDRLTAATEHNPDYDKAFYRRGDCYWELGQHSSCYGDLQRCTELRMHLDAEHIRRRDTSKAKMDEEMSKMMGQLKDLGNMFLGKFGMSTDNFKFDKDPNSGGYNMRFER